MVYRYRVKKYSIVFNSYSAEYFNRMGGIHLSRKIHVNRNDPLKGFFVFIPDEKIELYQIGADDQVAYLSPPYHEASVVKRRLRSHLTERIVVGKSIETRSAYIAFQQAYLLFQLCRGVGHQNPVYFPLCEVVFVVVEIINYSFIGFAQLGRRHVIGRNWGI